MSQAGLLVTVHDILRYLDRHVNDADQGVAAIGVCDYANCAPKALMMLAERGYLPGYVVIGEKHLRVILDAKIMDGFVAELYARARIEMTDRQCLQVEIARLINTSVDDARGSIKDVQSIRVLRLARLLSANRKTLFKALDAEIKRREKRERW